MTGSSANIEVLLASNLLKEYPAEAADHIERMSAKEAAGLLSKIESRDSCHTFRLLSASAALDILEEAGASAGGDLLVNLPPSQAGSLLGCLSDTKRTVILAALPPADARELKALADYPADSAGRLRDPRIVVFHATNTVKDALSKLRKSSAGQAMQSLFIVANDGGLIGAIPLHKAALAEPGTLLSTLVDSPPVTASPFTSRAAVVETMERAKLASLPVVGPGNVPIGVLRLNELLQEVGKEFSADVVSLTGASKDETALSGPGFAVRKRLPWLLINLATAFLAAGVVGVFESTIARFTALAVLLPVVAGQSGNTGSQALAIVVRGLALREITRRSWRRVAMKELTAGAVNGFGVAVFACAGVYLWNGSLGLVLVIGVAMVVAMATAGLAGALIPIMLAALGQDPAQSSSIVLTTVTDIFGFACFLGLATLLSNVI